MISKQKNGHFVSRKFLRETEKIRNLYPACRRETDLSAGIMAEIPISGPKRSIDSPASGGFNRLWRIPLSGPRWFGKSYLGVNLPVQ